MGLMLGPDNPYGFWTARYSWAGTDFMLNMLRSEAIGWLTTVRNNRGGTLDDCSSDLPESVDWCDYEPIHVGNYFPVLDRQNTVRGYYDMELREGPLNTTPMVAMYEYDSFGKPTHEEGLLHSPYRFTGREYDPETGYYFYRARYYDPSLGRFLTQDPVFHNDLYSYVGNNPINFADPYGMNIWDDIKAVIDFAKDPQGAIQKGIDEVMGQPTQGPADENEPPEPEEEEASITPDTSTPSGGAQQKEESATGGGQTEQTESEIIKKDYINNPPKGKVWVQFGWNWGLKWSIKITADQVNEQLALTFGGGYGVSLIPGYLAMGKTFDRDKILDDVRAQLKADLGLGTANAGYSFIQHKWSAKSNISFQTNYGVKAEVIGTINLTEELKRQQEIIKANPWLLYISPDPFSSGYNPQVDLFIYGRGVP